MNILRIQNEIERRFLVSRMEIFQFNLEISFFSLFFPRYLYVCNLHLHRVLVVNNIRLYCANQKQQTELFFLFNNCFRTEIEHLLFFTLWSRNCFTLKPKKKKLPIFRRQRNVFRDFYFLYFHKHKQFGICFIDRFYTRDETYFAFSYYKTYVWKATHRV